VKEAWVLGILIIEFKKPRLNLVESDSIHRNSDAHFIIQERPRTIDTNTCDLMALACNQDCSTFFSSCRWTERQHRIIMEDLRKDIGYRIIDVVRHHVVERAVYPWVLGVYNPIRNRTRSREVG
jgi:hypothetical protein